MRRWPGIRAHGADPPATGATAGEDCPAAALAATLPHHPPAALLQHLPCRHRQSHQAPGEHDPRHAVYDRQLPVSSVVTYRVVQRRWGGVSSIQFFWAFKKFI